MERFALMFQIARYRVAVSLASLLMTIPVPLSAVPDSGSKPRLYTTSEKRSTSKSPILSISVPLLWMIRGPAGIRNINVLWDDTATFKDETIPMVKALYPSVMCRWGTVVSTPNTYPASARRTAGPISNPYH